MTTAGAPACFVPRPSVLDLHVLDISAQQHACHVFLVKFRPYRLVRSACGDEYGVGAVEVWKYFFEVIDLGQVIVDNVGLGGMECHVILVVVLGGEELSSRLDFGDDCGVVDARLIGLCDGGLGDARPRGVWRGGWRWVIGA